MSMETSPLDSASTLPDDWDRLARNYFQSREFLLHAETYNPCRQRYYCLNEGGELRAGAVVYELKVDLLTFLSIPSPVRMTIVGVPCSVSVSGVLGDSALIEELLRRIAEREKGLLLCLNLDVEAGDAGMVCARGLPDIVFENRFRSWEEYLSSQRNRYRHRLKRIEHDFEGVQKETVPCSHFDERMYALYRQVHGRSQAKLETLSLDFFKNLPSCFELTAYRHGGDLLGWQISVFRGDRHYFFFGGVDYDMNSRFNTYNNVLIHSLRSGIERGVRSIVMGQTAEMPKMELGGKALELKMAATHSNGLIRTLLRPARTFLAYTSPVPELQVFRATAGDA
jgi:hypothetical protein